MHRQVLPNGMTILVAPHRAAPVVALQAWVRVGSCQEASREAGIAHFLEHMLFKGTKRRDVGELALEIESAGGDINAWTEFNSTGYHLVIAKRYFELGLDVLADALQHPSIDAKELERERQVIIEEIQQGEDNPHRVNFQKLFRLAFQVHPYRRPVIGQRECVQQLKRADLLRFHRQWYPPNNITFIVAGDIGPEEVFEKCRRAFRARRRRLPRRQQPVEPPQRHARVDVRTAPVSDAYLLAGFHIPGLGHADTPALDLAATLLGQGESARLTQRILRERQLVNDVSAYAYTPHDEGLFTVGATLPVDRLPEAVAGILEETFALGVDPVTQDELVKAQLLIEASAVMQRETAQGLARKIGYYHHGVGDPDYEQTYLRQLAELSTTQCKAAMARHLTAHNCSLSVVIPEGSPTKLGVLRKWLKSASPAAARTVRERRTSRVPRPGQGGIVRARLDNGLRVLVKEERSVPLVAVRAAWQGGLRYESARVNGVNNLLANMLTRGTNRRSGDEIVEAVESMAGAIGGFTGRNSLGMRLETIARNFTPCLEIMADCLRSPAFPEQELARERDLALQEIAVRDDNLTGTVFRLFQRTLWRRHPYRLSLGGERASVGRLSRTGLKRYFQKHYRAAGLTVSVVGDVDAGHVLAEIERLFGNASATVGRPVDVAPEPRPSSPRSAALWLDRQQAHVLLGFQGVSVFDPHRHALEVLAAVLSGQGGRLFLNVRDRQGLVYRINAFSLEGIDPGYFAVYGATSPDKVEALLTAIRDELRRVRTEPVSRAELSRAKRYLIGNHDLSLQQRATFSSTLVFNELYGLGYAAHLAYPGAIRAVTARDLQRVARRYLAPQREILATVLPSDARAPADRRRRRVVRQHKPSDRKTR